MDTILQKRDLSNVAEYKIFLKNLIDENTSNSIKEGFAFDSRVFSMSFSAQINWSNIMNVPDELFPLNVSCKDDTVYSLSLANKSNFYLTALNFKNNLLQAGSALRFQVEACTTIEELDVIKDSLQ